MGRLASRSKEASTLEELGKLVTKQLADRANSSLVVCVGKDDSSVMPYVWIRRNDDDRWEGELGDCVKLGIDEGLLIEKDPIRMLSIDQAVAEGLAEVYGEEDVRVISVPYEPPQPKVKKSQPKAKKKLSDEETWCQVISAAARVLTMPLKSKEPTDEQIEHNMSLWKWFPLGQVDAIWNLVEHLSQQVDLKYPKEVEAVLDALQKLDDKIRADYYPLPVKKVKQSNGILQPRSKKRRAR